jgi:hypothetical protein
METTNTDKEPVIFTMEMMVQLIEQLNAVTTYFDLMNVKMNKMQERIKELEKKNDNDNHQQP